MPFQNLTRLTDRSRTMLVRMGSFVSLHRCRDCLPIPLASCLDGADVLWTHIWERVVLWYDPHSRLSG